MTVTVLTPNATPQREEMAFVGYRPSKRADRKRALLWRMVAAKRDTAAHLSKLARERRNNLNLENKPLGA